MGMITQKMMNLPSLSTVACTQMMGIAQMIDGMRV